MAETQQVDFAELVAGAVRGLVEAQAALDEHARQRVEAYVDAPAGSLALPPLWYSFRDVAFELQLSATVRSHEGGSRLACRTLNPSMVGLFGYEASAGMRVRMLLGRNGFVPVKPPEDPAGGGPSPT